jgi:putative nucleotidyltransferase with HDIG domain
VESSIVTTLYRIIQVRDSDTAEHSRLVSLWSAYLAQMFDPINSHDYAIAGLLHDIGKIGMSDRILKGSERLTLEDRESLVNHTETGYWILSTLTNNKIILDSARSHHERYDGSGYGNKLVGEEIPLCARIVGIADTYSTLVQGRLYKEKVSTQEALNIMWKDRHLFDPNILERLLNFLSSGHVS